MIVEILLALFTVFLFLKWWSAKPKGFPPGPPALPFIGSLLSIEAENVHFYIEKLKHKYGNVIGVKLGDKNAVFIRGPQVFECLKKEEFNGRPHLTHGTLDVFPKGIMFANGNFWSSHRRFVLRHLRDFGFGKSSTENVILGEFEDFVKHNMNQDVQTLQVNLLFNKSAINVLWTMIAGKRFVHDDPEFSNLSDCLYQVFRSGVQTGGILLAMPFLKDIIPGPTGYSEQLRFGNNLKAYLEKTIQQHRETKGEEPRDLIDIYLQQENISDSSFDQLCLMSACDDLFSAGTESTSNTLAFCVLYCCLYPQIQEKVYEEIKTVLGHEKPCLMDKNRLPYTEAFLCEVIRSNPIAPVTAPHQTQTDVVFDGYNIPKDTFITVSLWSLFQDEKHFGDPENFRPSRFIDSNGQFIKDEYMIPFGIGRRVCIGESLARSVLFIFFISLVQHFEFLLPEHAPRPSTICMSGFTTAPQPFEAVFRRRH